MRVFISQPMRGRSNEEIRVEREGLAGKARELYGDEIEIVDSFFEDAPVGMRPLWYLSVSLMLLSTADVAIFAGDWQGARGCRIEHTCALEYGLEVVEDYSMLYGALGTLVGWKTRGRFYGATAEPPAAAELRRMREEQEAFHSLQNYNADIAYGVSAVEHELERGEQA